MSPIFISILFGIIGGFVRALIGLWKFYGKKKGKRKKFRWGYIGFSLMVSGIVGVFAGALEGGNWRFALLMGYVWTDFLEGMSQIFQEEVVDV